MKIQSFAPVVLRLGLAAVFLWFGLSELVHPAMWTSYIPTWLVNSININVTGLVILNGLFEVVMAILLAFGILSRWVALLLLAHLVGIIVEVGLDPVGIRDVGLAFGLLSVVLQGKDFATRTPLVNSVATPLSNSMPVQPIARPQVEIKMPSSFDALQQRDAANKRMNS